VVTGGADVGGYLVSHPGVGKVAFTGSVAAGRKIGEACGRLFRPMTLELGGKSAAIVLDDSDMAATVQGIATSFMLNAGQTCYLSSRVLLPRSRYSEVVEAVAAAADSLTIGNSLDPATQVGPLISSAQRERVESYIRGGVADGARLVTGGKRPGLEKGWFLQPTVFADVDNRSKIAQEEIFGPVLTMAPYDSLDEAVAIANDSTYGLAGTIWTTDLERGKEVARRVEAGAIGINFFGVDVLSPFGGYKDSGIGRELGPEGLDAYFQVKSIFVPNASTN
jgi:acyl-CoA reductase-like NAD-dependent aldehyde dehydrogenase